jgi:hypothetical protein
VSQTVFIQRPLRVAVGGVLLVLGSLATLRFGAGGWIVAKAAGIPQNAQGIGGFVNGAKQIIGTSLGVLLLLGSVTALID